MYIFTTITWIDACVMQELVTEKNMEKAVTVLEEKNKDEIPKLLECITRAVFNLSNNCSLYEVAVLYAPLLAHYAMLRQGLLARLNNTIPVVSSLALADDERNEQSRIEYDDGLELLRDFCMSVDNTDVEAKTLESFPLTYNEDVQLNCFIQLANHVASNKCTTFHPIWHQVTSHGLKGTPLKEIC